jgi:hypothetical protein
MTNRGLLVWASSIAEVWLLFGLGAGDRVGAGLTPAPPTPPGVRVRTGRFA